MTERKLPQKGKPSPARANQTKPQSGRAPGSTPKGSRVRSKKTKRKKAPVGRKQGLNLRMKILIMMIGVTLVTTLIIFFVIRGEAIGRLDDSVNESGNQLLNLLASVGDEFWLMAIHTRSYDGGRTEWEHQFGTFLEELVGSSNIASLKENPKVWEAYERLKNPFGSHRDRDMAMVLESLTEGGKWRKELDKDQLLRKEYETILFPLPELESLKPLQTFEDLRGQMGQRLISAGVADTGTAGQTLAVTFKGHQSISNLPEPSGKEVKVENRLFDPGDGRGVLNTRWFVRDMPDAGLRYFIILSLDNIDDAQAGMTNMILLTLLLTCALAVGSAIWLAGRIDQPLQALMNDIDAVSGGDFDHETLPHSNDEIGQLALTFNEMTRALSIARAQELEQKTLEHELSIASEIQGNLLPLEIPKIMGFDLAAYYRPSKEVGGDYYDFLQIDDNNIGVIVADVSGKGVPGSLVMSMARAFVRMEAERSRNASTADTMIRVNRMLAQDIKKGMFVTALYGILDARTRTLRISSAGHNPMVVVRQDGTRELVNPPGIALGFDKGPVFERTIREEKVVLSEGDVVLMYTDGTVEAMNEKNEEFGDDRFYELCGEMADRTASRMVNGLIDVLDDFKGAGPQHDDMTLLAIKVMQPEA